MDVLLEVETERISFADKQRLRRVAAEKEVRELLGLELLYREVSG